MLTLNDLENSFNNAIKDVKQYSNDLTTIINDKIKYEDLDFCHIIEEMDATIFETKVENYRKQGYEIVCSSYNDKTWKAVMMKRKAMLILDELKNCFQSAISEKAEYILVKIKCEWNEFSEIFTIKKENFHTRLQYYLESYNEDLTYKYSNDIRILGFWI